jgi:alcohol dehydrogenase class IV
MEYNSLAIPGRLAEIAEALGEDTTGLSDREAAYLAVETVSQLNEDLGIPLCLEELGVGMEDLPAIAEETVKVTRLLTNNPRTMTREEALGLFERMWRGLR